MNAQSGNRGASNQADNSLVGQRQESTQQLEDTRPLRELSPDELAERLAANDRDLQPYGYDLFKGAPSTFAPVNNAPVPADYELGIGDEIFVQFYGKENRSINAVVDREGRLVIDNLGPMQVAGLSYSEVKAMIRSRAKERLIGIDVAVSMGELRSMQIFVVGEAYKPGAYTVSSLTTLSQALFVSGGVSDIASLRDIQLKRDGETVVHFDLYDLLINGDASSDALLRPGDVVFIPTRGDLVSIVGEVLRPALYEIKADETLNDVLAMAGGLLPNAYRDSVRVQRYARGNRAIETVNISERGGDYALRGGDVVTIQSMAEETVDSVMVVGAAVRPGLYEWRNGMRIKDVLRSVDSALLPVTDLNYGLVVHSAPDRRNISISQFDVGLAVNGVAAENLELQPRDQIVLFSRYESAEAEASQLSAWLKTESEIQREQRDKVLRQYRRQYLQNLIDDKSRTAAIFNNDNEEALGELSTELTNLFDTRNVEERRDDYYAKFSRRNLLQPILYKLRNQFTASGELALIFVEGEVRYPGVYPLAANGGISDAVAAAGGLKESAYLARSEITRTDVIRGEAVTDYLQFSLEQALAGQADMPLQGRDRLHVLSIPQWQNIIQVRLEGEVRFPGTYAIRRGETLGDVIKRAGGLTDYAFPRGAVFTRTDLREAERKRLQELSQQLRREIASNSITDSGNTIAYSEMNQLLRDLTNIEAVGRLIIDLNGIMAANTDRADIQLKDGDRLYIPTVQNTVSIIGEVQLASSYQYDANITLEDYIERAGGTRQKADEERVYVVKADGSVMVPERSSWFSARATQIEPGDTIIVPLDTQYVSSIETWSTVTQIMYQVGVALAAISGL
ncbi:polysaccharide biosynthesis protein [Pseudidiomarina aestuarii]|uniref:Polysaccharide biosynthesis protein n=2 Tax=Pseudidiomarina aestuarii TaxID=624146 RepID=A0A7Z6ZW72_9GAMM|nr:polysaccharide biosynthesis protein [Pseudidiomarina aestuarii]